MLTGGAIGELELRKGGGGSRRLSGRFPYNRRATLSDGGRSGRPRKEAFHAGAFAYRVNLPEEDIHLLIGHDYNRPLASRGAGTMTLKDTPEALTFEAEIASELQQAPYVRDFFGAFKAGLIVGISPGFRIPPNRVSPDAEKVEEEDPAEGRALIRTVYDALLFELSLVTVPAYKETTIEERNWTVPPDNGLHRTFARWRI